jgi:hypothetical protein
VGEAASALPHVRVVYRRVTCVTRCFHSRLLTIIPEGVECEARYPVQRTGGASRDPHFAYKDHAARIHGKHLTLSVQAYRTLWPPQEDLCGGTSVMCRRRTTEKPLCKNFNYRVSRVRRIVQSSAGTGQTLWKVRLQLYGSGPESW